MTWNLKEIEKQTIIQCIKYCKGNKIDAAKLLGISYRGLRKKLVIYREDKSLKGQDKQAVKKGRVQIK